MAKFKSFDDLIHLTASGDQQDDSKIKKGDKKKQEESKKYTPENIADQLNKFLNQDAVGQQTFGDGSTSLTKNSDGTATLKGHGYSLTFTQDGTKGTQLGSGLTLSKVSFDKGHDISDVNEIVNNFSSILQTVEGTTTGAGSTALQKAVEHFKDLLTKIQESLKDNDDVKKVNDITFKNDDEVEVKFTNQDGVKETVTAKLSAPILDNDSATLQEDNQATIDVLKNDSNYDDATVSIATTPEHGTAKVQADNTILYTPNKNYNGEDSFTYKLGNSIATVNLTIDPVNDAPVAKSELLHIDTIGQPLSLLLNGKDLLKNDSDIDNDTLTLNLPQTTKFGGKITYLSNDLYEIAHNTNYTGLDVINYTVSDGNETSSEASTLINRSPIVEDTSFSLTIGEPKSLQFLIDKHSSDPDGDSLSFDFLNPPLHTQIMNSMITALPGFTGQSILVYNIKDEHGGIGYGTAQVTLEPTNQAPDAVDDAFDLASGNKLIFTDNDLFSNDSDPDSDPLSVVAFTSETSEKGKVALNNGEYTYTPADGFTGTDTFTYTVSDGNGGTDTATVSVTVAGDSNGGDNGSGDNGSGDNGSGDNGSGDNGSGDNGSGDNGSGDNGNVQFMSWVEPSDDVPEGHLLFSFDDPNLFPVGDNNQGGYIALYNQKIEASFGSEGQITGTVKNDDNKQNHLLVEATLYPDVDDVDAESFNNAVSIPKNGPSEPVTFLSGLFGTTAIGLKGSVGNDTLEGNSGVDYLFGGEGNDYLYSHDNDDILEGGAGDDILEGGAGDDHLTGGAGADNLEGGAGDDILEGGAGIDTFTFSLNEFAHDIETVTDFELGENGDILDFQYSFYLEDGETIDDILKFSSIPGDDGINDLQIDVHSDRNDSDTSQHTIILKGHGDSFTGDVTIPLVYGDGNGNSLEADHTPIIDTGDNGSGDNGSGDNGSGDNGTGDNGSGDNGTGDPDPGLQNILSVVDIEGIQHLQFDFSATQQPQSLTVGDGGEKIVKTVVGDNSSQMPHNIDITVTYSDNIFNITAIENEETLGETNLTKTDSYGEDDTFLGLLTNGLPLSIKGGVASDTIASAITNVQLHLDGGPGDDTLYGAQLDDTLYGGAGDDFLAGDDGNDILEGGPGDDTLSGDYGYNTFLYTATNAGNDVILDFKDHSDVLDLSSLITLTDTSPNITNFITQPPVSDAPKSSTILSVYTDGSAEAVQNNADFSIKIVDYPDVDLEAWLRDNTLLVQDNTSIPDGDPDILSLVTYNDTEYLQFDLSDISADQVIEISPDTYHNQIISSDGDGGIPLLNIYVQTGANDDLTVRARDVESGDLIGIEEIAPSLLSETEHPTFNDLMYSGIPISLKGSDGVDILVTHYDSGSLLIGEDGDDELWGSAYNDILKGGDGDDFLVGDYGDDLLIDGAGNDILIGGVNDNNSIDGEGIDTFKFLMNSVVLPEGEIESDTITDFDLGPAGDTLDLSSLLPPGVDESSIHNHLINGPYTYPEHLQLYISIDGFSESNLNPDREIILENKYNEFVGDEAGSGETINVLLSDQPAAEAIEYAQFSDLNSDPNGNPNGDSNDPPCTPGDLLCGLDVDPDDSNGAMVT